MKHTKGQWDVNPTNGNIESGEVTVAIPHGPAGRMIDVSEEHEANAKLIAAAPEMIKEMQSYIEHLERNGRTRANSFYFSFKEVIKKATS